MADEVLPEGLRFFNKKDNQPDFVIGTQVITLNALFSFCKAHPELVTEYNGEKQLKLQIKKSKNGNIYASVDTWKPAEQTATPVATAPPLNKPVELPVEDPNEPLPF